MAVKVRVQNFQSIEDVTIIIDGLTVITGTNNSGKTAVMRAIRGVFTNASAGPLVRHGCAHLSVTLTFDDGTAILWEKGWEKPGQKGKTVNRYTINGKQIATVGRGVPPEVEALGVREIRAASDRVWPQIADQFDGTLFLVNRPGSAVAEALSDVERVGKLNAALKASEKDRRAVNAELKVRSKDVEAYKQAVGRYEGLDAVGEQIRGLDQARKGVVESGALVETVGVFRDRHGSIKAKVESLAGFDPSVIPDSTQSDKLSVWSMKIETVGVFRDRHGSIKAKVESLAGFDPSVIPDSTQSDKLSVWSRKVGVVEGYRDRHRSASSALSDLSGFDPSVIPDSARVEKLNRVVEVVSVFQHRHRKASEAVSDLSGFVMPDLPDTADLDGLGSEVGVVRTLRDRHEAARASVDAYAGFSSAEVSDESAVEAARSDIDVVNTLFEQFHDAHDTLDSLDGEAKRVAAELALAESEVKRLLGDRGVCPTCNTIHEGVHT